MRHLRFSNAEVERTTQLLAAYERPLPDASVPSSVRRWLSRVGAEAVRDTLRLHAASVRARGSADAVRSLATLARAILATWRARPPLTLADLAITGDDLKEMGLPPGPRFAEILDDCLERVLDDPGMNTLERMRAYVKERWMAGASAREP
jgi:tRNA nucleotidyltransferase (CCA-adding enzyme)